MASEPPIFPAAEYEQRIDRVRALMAQRGLDGLIISSPENIYYLCGLDHMGYFAYQALVIPADGDLALITRAMEAATVRDQVPHLRHLGYSDGQTPPPRRADDVVFSTVSEEGRAGGLQPWEMSLGVQTREPGTQPEPAAAPVAATIQALRALGLERASIGLEQANTFLPAKVAQGLMAATPNVRWHDSSGLVDDCRFVQSPLELERTRLAASISDSMMLAAIAAAGPDQRTSDIMASIYATMFRRGGTYPGFVPLVRTTRTLQHEHGTWRDDRLRRRDLLFLEMAGCKHRYHAPLGRLVFIGSPPRQASKMLDICRGAMESAAETMRPGVEAGTVYSAWQAQLDKHGLHGYTRHHCGYAVGIGYPPSWSGSGVPIGLRAGSSMKLRAGMVFHLMSWLLRTGKGDSFLSDTVVITKDGCEWLTTVGRKLYQR